jgi:hypothetical protein
MGMSSEMTHLLSMGLALCGKMGYPINTWPLGHGAQKLTEYMGEADSMPGADRRYCAECVEAAVLWVRRTPRQA